MLMEPLKLSKRSYEGEFSFSTVTPRHDLDNLKTGSGMPFYLRNLKTESFDLLWFIMEWREVSPDGQTIIVHGRDDNNFRDVEVKYHLVNSQFDRVSVRLRTPAII